MGILRNVMEKIFAGKAAAIKQAAEQEEIKVHLIKLHGEEMAEILFDAAVKVSQESDMTLREAADYVTERKWQMDDFAKRLDEVWSNIRLTVQEVWSQIQKAVQEYEGQAPLSEKEKRSRKLMYKKKKSQARNWRKKWRKKRK